MENEIKELESMKACKHMAVEDSHNVDHKNETDKFSDYVRRLRLILSKELSAKNKMQATGT
jgi:hypothetical protein